MVYAGFNSIHQSSHVNSVKTQREPLLKLVAIGTTDIGTCSWLQRRTLKARATCWCGMRRVCCNLVAALDSVRGSRCKSYSLHHPAPWSLLSKNTNVEQSNSVVTYLCKFNGYRYSYMTLAPLPRRRSGSKHEGEASRPAAVLPTSSLVSSLYMIDLFTGAVCFVSLYASIVPATEILSIWMELDGKVTISMNKMLIPAPVLNRYHSPSKPDSFIAIQRYGLQLNSVGSI